MTYWKPQSDRQIRKNLDKLIDRNLLFRQGNDHLTIHDLQLAYVRKQCGNIVERHKRLLDSYNPDMKQWYLLPDDGYLYSKLAFHLSSIEEYEQLYHLLTDSPDWIDTKFGTLGEIASVSTDIQIALNGVQANDSESVLRQGVLWALANIVDARINTYDDNVLTAMSLLGLNFPDEQQLVKRAFGYARARNNHRDRLKGYEAIASLLPKDHPLMSTLLAEINTIEGSVPELEAQVDHEDRIVKSTDEEPTIKSTEDSTNFPLNDSDPSTYLNEIIQLMTNNKGGLPKLDANKVASAIEKSSEEQINEFVLEMSEILKSTTVSSLRMYNFFRRYFRALFESEYFDALNILAALLHDQFLHDETLVRQSEAFTRSQQFSNALEVAAKIKDKKRYSSTLLNISGKMARVADQRTKDIFELGVKQRIGYVDLHSFVFAGLVLVDTLWRINQPGKAWQVLSLETIDKYLNETDDSTLAVERSFLQKQISITEAYLGNTAFALNLAHSIGYERGREVAILDIIVALAEKGEFYQAHQISSAISDNVLRLMADFRILKRLHKTDPQAAYDIYSRIDLNFAHKQPRVLRDMYEAQLILGMVPEAIDTALLVEGNSRDQTVIRVIEDLLEKSDFKNAELLLSNISDERYRVSGICKIAVAATAFDTDKTDALLSQAEAIATATSDVSKRADAFCIVAETYHRLGNIRSLSILDTAIRSCKDNHWSAQFANYSPYGTIAISVAQMGKYDMAFDVWLRSDREEEAMIEIIETVARREQADTVHELIDRFNKAAKHEISDLRLKKVLAHSLAKQHQFSGPSGSFRVIGIVGHEEYLRAMTNWTHIFEDMQPDFSLRIFSEVTRIYSWLNPLWQDVHEVLAN